MNHVEIINGFELPKRKSLKVWRYLDFDKFKSLVDKQALYFASARQFDDSFEGSITKREYEFNLKHVGSKGIETDFYKKKYF